STGKRPSRPSAALHYTVPARRGVPAASAGSAGRRPARPSVAKLPDGAGDVAGHGAQFGAPRSPAVVSAAREVEVAVVPADTPILLVERQAAAHRLIGR